MGCMPRQNGRLWRGIAADLYDEYEEGKEIVWWTVSSCTSDVSVAKNFMNQLGGTATLMILDVENAMDIMPLSIYPHECESLLAPGIKLKVCSHVMPQLCTHVHTPARPPTSTNACTHAHIPGPQSQEGWQGQRDPCQGGWLCPRQVRGVHGLVGH